MKLTRALCTIVCQTLLFFYTVDAAELTFELPDRDKACYHQKLREKVKSVFEFQVITGGKYDVDVVITGPNEEQIYRAEKKQYDTHEFVPTVNGDYRVCFSNEFSTFTHKVVYFEWQDGPEKKLTDVIGEKPTALTQMESSSVRVHDSLRVVEDFQTNFRNKEMQGRSFAEDLNERVMYWSIGQAFLILVIGVGQVMVLKSFFAEKRTSVKGTGINT